MLPAGTFKVRSNDTDYRFRPDTAHTYFSGNQTSDAVLVIDDGEAVLYARPRSARDTDEFFRDRQYGELWAGRRPSLQRDLRLPRPRGPPHRRPAVALGGDRQDPGAARRRPRVDAWSPATSARRRLARVLSEMRLVKDDWEVAELQEACDITTLGFEDSVREWDRVLEYGERWIEGTFFRRARAMGNDIGYDSIVGGGAHATTLHWIENTGPITPGELVLLDMGVEGRNLYTADVTRTLPVDGTLHPAPARPLRPRATPRSRPASTPSAPACRSSPPTTPRWTVLAHGLERPGPAAGLGRGGARPRVARSTPAGPCTAPATCSAWTCTTAATPSPDIYPEGDLAEGMVLTVEPGLYFQEDDLLVPEELRGIGIRIEDDILVTADGSQNLSAALPRTSADVEAWMGRLRG